MIDKKHIGRTVSRHSVEVGRGRVRLFATAIGASCLPSDADGRLQVPPTFLFCLEMERPDPYDWYPVVGLELPKLLHGEQSFEYHRPCHEGDTLHFEARIDSIYSKKGGALEFVSKSTLVSGLDGEPVATLRSLIIQRHA